MAVAIAEKISLAEVKRASRACRVSTEKRREHESAEAEKKVAMMVIFEKLLGIKSEADVAEMSPEAIQKLGRKRIRAGLVELDGIEAEVLLEKVIQKSQSRRNVSWKDVFIGLEGESKATDIIANTPESFSYKFNEIPA